MRAQWRRSEKEWKRLQEAGVDDKVINSAISAFIVQVHPFVLIKEQRLKEKRKPVFCYFAPRNNFLDRKNFNLKEGMQICQNKLRSHISRMF